MEENPIYGCLLKWNQLFSNNSHILDNSAYPLKDWLLTPYQRNRHLSGYNYKYGDQKGI